MKTKKIDQIREMINNNSISFTPDERAIMKKYRFDPATEKYIVFISEHTTNGQRINPPDRDIELLEGLEKKLGIQLINFQVPADE